MTSSVLERPDRVISFSPVCLALSAIALGHPLQFLDGFYNPLALAWLTGSLLLAIVGTFAERANAGMSTRTRAAVVGVLACGITWQVQQLLSKSPGTDITNGDLEDFRVAVVAQAGLAALGVLRLPPVKRVWFPAFLVVSLGIGVWMIKASPHPRIDVIAVHRGAIDALVHGRDPYRISIANTSGDLAVKLYNPAVIVGDRILIAYPYPPVSLLLALPGQVLFGDYRYAELALLVAAAALIGFTRQGLTPKLAAALLLTTPSVWNIIEQGFSEPIAVFLLALTTFLLIRSQIAAGLAVGAFLVAKQYLGFTGLAVLRMVFMRRREAWKVAIACVFIACATTLPIALWHPNAFMRNVVWLQTLEPFREDSLSYLSWAARRGWGRGSYLWAVMAGSAAGILCPLATRNTPAGFATSVALTTFMTFAFGSKAFINYYFFVVGALCCALAALPREGEPHFS